MIEHRENLYELSNGTSVTSLSRFPSPRDEYRAAFADRAQPFLEHYAYGMTRNQRAKDRKKNSVLSNIINRVV